MFTGETAYSWWAIWKAGEDIDEMIYADDYPFEGICDSFKARATKVTAIFYSVTLAFDKPYREAY